MDPNEISFEALFKCADFEWCDSPKLESATRDLREFLKSKLDDHDACDEISSASIAYCSAAQESGFEQGFRFAVKLLKNLYDMSFPDVPPRAY